MTEVNITYIHKFGLFEDVTEVNITKHPGTDTGEDPHHQNPREITVDHAHKSLLPPYDEADHDALIAHRLIGHIATTPACVSSSRRGMGNRYSGWCPDWGQ